MAAGLLAGWVLRARLRLAGVAAGAGSSAVAPGSGVSPFPAGAEELHLAGGVAGLAR